MDTKQKMIAISNLGPRAGLRCIHPGGWYVGGIETSDGKIRSSAPVYAETPDAAVDLAWEKYVERLPANEHLVIEVLGRTLRTRWDAHAGLWAEVRVHVLYHRG